MRENIVKFGLELGNFSHFTQLQIFAFYAATFRNLRAQSVNAHLQPSIYF